MTTTETINIISELSVNLKSATDNDDDMKEADRVYLNGLCAGLKLASDTIRKSMNDSLTRNQNKHNLKPSKTDVLLFLLGFILGFELSVWIISMIGV